MRRIFALLLASGFLWSAPGFGWGEAGHHIVGRLSAKLVGKHPDFKDMKDGDARKALDQYLKVLKDRRYQQGYLGNIPDIYWRNLEEGLAATGNQLGSPTHFFDAEYLAPETSKDPFAETKLPLDYEAAKAYVSQLYPGTSLFKTVGTAPWRAQQFTNLTKAALEGTPKATCESLEAREDHPTRAMLTFAGLLTHFTADAAMPLHSTRDTDGIATGQKGLHWYFENELVDVLEPTLETKVEAAAEKMLLGPEKQKGSLASLMKKMKDRFPELKPQDRVTALVFMELADSNAAVKRLRDLDLKYAIATAEEALTQEACLPIVSAVMGELEKTPSKAKRRELLRQKALGSKEPEQAPCRRASTALVDWGGVKCKVASADCRMVATWHESLIVERLALATAITADILAQAWKEAGSPSPCWTWKYAMKPAFISPTDAACFGYAKGEKFEDLLTPPKPVPALWRTSSKTALDCARF